VQWQVIDRTHCIGQTKNVFAYRFVKSLSEEGIQYLFG